MMYTRQVLGIAIAALACGVLAGCQQERRDNAAVTADIRRELAEQQLPNTINVAVTDGVANLSGTVRDEGMRSKAEDVAEDIDGVTRVVNNIRVTAAGDAPAGQRPGMGAGPGAGGPGARAPGAGAPGAGAPGAGAPPAGPQGNPAANPGSENAPGAGAAQP